MKVLDLTKNVDFIGRRQSKIGPSIQKVRMIGHGAHGKDRAAQRTKGVVEAEQKKSREKIELGNARQSP